MFSEVGCLHRSMNLDNDDAVASVANDSVAVIVACDGAGGLCAGGVAAKLVSKTVANELCNKFKELYFSDSGSARWAITQVIVNCLTSYAEENNLVPSDLACTIIAAAVDNEGRCVCFHLGDGIIFRHKKGKNSWDVVSSPRNGLTKNTTYLTMNCNIWYHLQYYRWKDPDLDNILLLTDGASEHLVCRDRKRGWRFADGCYTDIPRMKKQLDALVPRDDYSGGMITRK